MYMENENKKSGFILIDKPVGPTSFDMVYKLRKITGIKKIGHAGTLDPFATGLLLLAIGRGATREISQYVKLDKTYIADLRLGAVSTTHDPEGDITENLEAKKPERKVIEKTLEQFVGEQKQIPPMFSAKKVGGQKLYHLARKGKIIERQPQDIRIDYINILSYEWPKLKIELRCSSGTYIRVLAFDVGDELGLGAYLTSLRRTEVGDIKVEEAYKIENIKEGNWEEKLFINKQYP